MADGRAGGRRARRPGRRGARARDARRAGSTCARCGCRSGVVAVVYEARPNVTIDCAALTIKSGNAIVLRGSQLRRALQRRRWRRSSARRWPRPGCPRTRSLLLAGGGREELAELATQEGLVDLLIPRGGEGLKDGAEGGRDGAGDVRGGRQLPRLRARRRRPRDGAADRRQRQGRSGPGVCNAAETLLVDAAVAERLPARRRSPTCATPGSSWSATSGRARPPASVEVGAGDRGGLGHRVPRPEDGGRRRRLARGGDRARQPPRHRPLGGDRHRLRGGGRARSPPGSTPPSSTSTPRPASPTASSSGWAPRSATRPRSCTRAARSACAS